MAKNTIIFKDFMITELSSRIAKRQVNGEFLVCRPVKDSQGNVSINLNLPDSIKQEMLDAVSHGQFVRLFTPGKRA